MSYSGGIRNLVDVLDSKTTSNAQNLIRSLLNAFPDDLNLTGEEQTLRDPTNNMDLDDQHSGILTPIRHDRSSSASTPTLSLPDSFDVDCFDITKLRKVGGDTTQGVPGRFPMHSVKPVNGCLKCGEMEQICNAEKAVLMSKCTELKSSLDSSLMKYDASQAELLRLQKMSGITEENQRLEIAALTDRCIRLSNLNESESALRIKYEERANRFDLADSELQRQRKENAELRATLEQQGKAVQILTASENAARRASEDAERARQLIALDKAHLQQELATMESRFNDKNRAAEASHSQCLALEVKVAQLTDQLLALQLTARSGFDERMDKEIQRLREENAQQMEGLKATSRDILDRENRVLREAKISMEQECNHLRQRNDSLSQQLSQLQNEMMNALQDKNTSISDLKAEVKMKSFELTNLGVTFEERMSQLRQTEAEVDVLRQEVSAHKSALLRMESESLQAEQQLRNELAQYNTRLRAYEALEEEIDSAVVRTAGLYGAKTSHDSAELIESTEEAARKLMHSVKGIPTNPERRVKQAVYLAQRLLEAERKGDMLQAELNKAKEAVAAAEKKERVATENLSRAAQPTSYLVNKLRDEENAKAAFLNKCQVLEAEAQRCRHEEANSKREAEQMRQRLQSLLQQRGELETVKVMLAQLSAMDAEDDDEDGEDDEQDEEGGDDDNYNCGGGRAAEGNWRGRDRGERGSERGRVGFSSPVTEEKRNSVSPPSQQQYASDPANSPHTTPVKSKRQPADLMSTAAALGLTPEQLKEMTSPPHR